jgi:hypothetical protein
VNGISCRYQADDPSTEAAAGYATNVRLPRLSGLLSRVSFGVFSFPLIGGGRERTPAVSLSLFRANTAEIRHFKGGVFRFCCANCSIVAFQQENIPPPSIAGRLSRLV